PLAEASRVSAVEGEPLSVDSGCNPWFDPGVHSTVHPGVQARTCSPVPASISTVQAASIRARIGASRVVTMTPGAHRAREREKPDDPVKSGHAAAQGQVDVRLTDWRAG